MGISQYGLYIHTCMHACRQTDKQTDRPTTCLPTYIPTYIYIYTAILPLVISGDLRFHAISLHSEVLCTITHFSRHPVVRYLNGLNRPLFLPFIPMLEAFTNVARLSKKRYWVSSLLGPFFFSKLRCMTSVPKWTIESWRCLECLGT